MKRLTAFILALALCVGLCNFSVSVSAAENDVVPINLLLGKGCTFKNVGMWHTYPDADASDTTALFTDGAYPADGTNGRYLLVKTNDMLTDRFFQADEIEAYGPGTGGDSEPSEEPSEDEETNVADLTYTVTYTDKGDGTANISVTIPEGIGNGKVVLSVSESLTLIEGSVTTVAGSAINITDEGIAVAFATVGSFRAGAVILSADYTIAEGAVITTADFNVPEWKLGDGYDPLTTQYDGDVIKVIFGEEEPSEDEHFTFAEEADTTNVVKSEVTDNLYFKAGGATASEIKELFKDGEITVTDANGNEVSDTAKIGTGATVTSTVNGVSQILTVVVLGDLNGDGGFSSADYTQALMCAKGKLSLAGFKLSAANVASPNADGSVSVTDITAGDYTQILMCAKGKLTAFNSQVK